MFPPLVWVEDKKWVEHKAQCFASTGSVCLVKARKRNWDSSKWTEAFKMYCYYNMLLHISLKTL